MKVSNLYICYYDVSEPLVQTQVLSYLSELAKRSIDVHLLTFERRRASKAERRSIFADLAAAGITWHHLRYHATPSLPATLYDILIGTLASIAICKKHNVKIVHARSHVPAAMALLLKQLFGCGFLFDMRGLLAEEYVDSGRWTRKSLSFRLTKRMERAFFRAADVIVMLTERIKQDLTLNQPELRGRRDDIEVIPCCVDTRKFAIPEKNRHDYRGSSGWDGRIVLTYAGKLGGWYLTDEMARLFAVARTVDSRFYFQVLTQSDTRAMARALEAHNLSGDDYQIRYIPPSQLPLALISSDAGISLIKASHSKTASSPTKIGEYLAAGLPVVSSAGIGVCDRMLRDKRLGVIVEEYSESEYRRVAQALITLLKTPGTAERCRLFAEQELSLSRVGAPRYSRIYDRLLGRPTGVSRRRIERLLPS